MNNAEQTYGRIIKGISGFYYVAYEGEVYECRARGKFRKEGVKPLIGDYVLLDSNRCMVDQILERKNQLVRPPISNIDELVIVVSAQKPQPDWLLVDKLIIAAKKNKIQVNLAINKCEDKAFKEVGCYVEMYQAAGCNVWELSAQTGQGIQEFQASLTKGVTALAGQSGVGKSSLINKLTNCEHMETGELSYKLGRGKNTTRHVEILTVSDDVFIVDTPGFSMFNALILPEELSQHYNEFQPYVNDCWYTPCSHVHEPQCAVIRAVEAGKISFERYQRYLELIKLLREEEAKPWEK